MAEWYWHPWTLVAGFLPLVAGWLAGGSGWLHKWQTLIAGFLALVAGWLTVRTTKLGADRQIAAANKQIRTAQRQIEVTLRIDRKRYLYESRQFLIALRAAVSTVHKHATAARRALLPQNELLRRLHTGVDLEVKRMFKGIQIFPELRLECIRLGGDLTPLFFELDDLLSDFRDEKILPGVRDDISTSLQKIRVLGRSLSDKAELQLAKCEEELRDLDRPADPLGEP